MLWQAATKTLMPFFVLPTQGFHHIPAWCSLTCSQTEKLRPGWVMLTGFHCCPRGILHPRFSRLRGNGYSQYLQQEPGITRFLFCYLHDPSPAAGQGERSQILQAQALLPYLGLSSSLLHFFHCKVVDTSLLHAGVEKLYSLRARVSLSQKYLIFSEMAPAAFPFPASQVHTILNTTVFINNLLYLYTELPHVWEILPGLPRSVSSCLN